MHAKHPGRKRRRYLEGLKAAASGNAQAFGFSILITVSYGIVSASVSSPSIGDQIGFAMSAVAAFSLLNILIACLAKHREGSIRNRSVLLIATATDFIAVGAGLSAATAASTLLTGLAAWILTPFVASVIYLLIQACELALGREAEQE